MSNVCRDLELHIPLPMSALPLPPTHQQGPRSASPRLGGAFSGHSPLASAASAPHVTISNAGGSVVQYHPPLYDISPTHFQVVIRLRAKSNIKTYDLFCALCALEYEGNISGK